MSENRRKRRQKWEPGSLKNSALIPIGKKGVALVDKEDFDRIAALKWRKYRIYAIAGKDNSTVLMHREVLRLGRSVDKKTVVHHINGNGFDNRKCNLQVISAKVHNRIHIDQRLAMPYRKPLGMRRGFVGVSGGGSWKTGIYIARIRGKYLGAFKTQREAARAVDIELRQLYGDSAFQNFPIKLKLSKNAKYPLKNKANKKVCDSYKLRYD